MAFVTGVLLEGERECGFDDPSWANVETLIENLLGFEVDGGHGTLTLEGPPNIQLSLCLGSNGHLMVNWHDWDTGEDWVLSSDGATGTLQVGDAEYPARQFVAPAVGIAAARTFFESGNRDPGLPWSMTE